MGVDGGDEGGIEAWLRLGEACGASRELLLDGRECGAGGALVGGCVRGVCAHAALAGGGGVFAYGNVCAGPDGKAAGAFERHYRWIDPGGLDYFRRRLVQAPRDSREALELTLKYCDTPSCNRLRWAR